MKRISCFTLLIIFFGCSNDDSDEELNISSIPSISLENFEITPAGTNQDSTKISISFTDGGENLGLDPEELDPPYHLRDFFYLENGQLMTTTNINRSKLLKIGEHDTLPDYHPCDYAIRRDDMGVAIDTVYTQQNLFHYNLIADLYIGENGEFERFDFGSTGDCLPAFRRRFPRIDNVQSFPAQIDLRAIKITLVNQSEGIISLNELTVPYNWLFKGKEIRFQIRLIDRDLNVSNTVITPPIFIE